MRTGLSGIATKTQVTAQWLFEIDGNYWTFGNQLGFNSNLYTSRVVSDSFRGIKEQNTDTTENLIPPNTTSFSIAGGKTDFSAPSFVGSDLVIRLIIDGVEAYAWRFYIKSCYYAYGKFNFTAEDFLQQYLFNNFFPNTPLLNAYNSTTAVFDGPDNACVPEVFGTAYLPLRMVPYLNEWYYVLGYDVGTYTVSKISSPTDFDQNSEYAPPTYTFLQSTLSGLQVFENNIGSAGDNAPFAKSNKLYDLPTQFSNSGTITTTNPADLISYILQKLGVPISQIDITGTFAVAKALYTTQGITYNFAFTTKEKAVDVLSTLLYSCNSILPRSDKVELISLIDDGPVKVLDRENILNINFSERIIKDSFDGGYAQYYTNVQSGEPSEIEIPIDGISSSNVSGEKILYPYTANTELVQKLSTIEFRRKFLQTGSLNFTSNHSLIDLSMGDRLSILDDFYEDYVNVYVDSITIQADLKFNFSLKSYSEPIGDLSSYTPAPVSKTADGSPYVELVSSQKLGTISEGADVTVDAIDAGIITNGVLADHATIPNLKIDFDNAEILVGHLEGLKIVSGGGVTVQDGGGLTIEDSGVITTEAGGEIVLEKDGAIRLQAGSDLYVEGLNTNPATIKFSFGTTASGSMGPSSTFADAIILYGNSAFDSQLDIDNFSRVEIITGIHFFVEVGVDRKLLITATDTTIENATSIEQVVGSYKSIMVDGIRVTENPRVMAVTSTTHDSYIGTSIGDNIKFHDASGKPCMRYRNSGGTISSGTYF